ncbi:MAG: hypothetical protein ACXADH_19100, partial [Candidatus Kariarchaeaceae archaeon]
PATRVDKYSFANDTTVAVADLPNPQFYSGATGNASFGYYMAGYRVAPSMQTTVNRLDYSNDTASMSVRGQLTFEKLGFKAVSAQSNAKTGTPLTVPASSPINYATNTVSYSTYGYFAGGYDIPPRRSSVERIDLSNDTANATQKANMSAIKQEQVGSSSLTHGYATGGYDGSNTTSSTFRIDFSNDTATPVTTGPFTRIITTTKSSHTGDYSWTAGGGSPNSYWAGGYFSSPITRHSNVDRIEYANDTAAATPKANLPEIRQQGSAVGNYDYGYWAGGYNGSSNQSSIYRFDYSNDSTQAAPRGNTIGAKTIMGGFNNRNYGYFGGGYDSSTAESTLVQRIDFANDTANLLPRGFLVETRAGASGHHSGNMVNPKPLLANVPTTTIATNFGYFGNGNANRLDRIDYTNDTVAALSRISPFMASPGGSAFPAAASSNYAGYWAPATYSYQNPHPNIRKVDYSNDTTSTIPGAFGYWAGGSPASFSGTSTTVSRIDYANDNAAALERGPLVNAVRQLAGVGNQNFGYFQTGAVGPGAANRIDYSNDTTTASPSGSLGIQYDNGIAGNGNFAYIAGGAATTSRVLRFDYSNDTTTASQRTYLSIAKTRLGATGNKNFGYFSGGRTPTAVSSIDRIDYSNDTATASPKGPLSGTQYQHGNTATSAAESNNPQ